MPFNGSGVYTAPAADFPVVTNTVISSTHFNNTINDIATGLSTCITKDGQSTPTANIKLGGFKLTGIGAPTIAGDALSEGAAIGAATPSTLRGTSLTLTTAASKIVPGATSLSLRNNADSADNLLISDAGVVTARLSIVTPIVDSGSTGALLLKTNNGSTQGQLVDASSTVNFATFGGAATGVAPLIGGRGEAATGVNFFWGTGTAAFRSDDNTVTQFQVLRTASATRNITVTGSNGGNPTISTTAGSLAITPIIVANTAMSIGSTPSTSGLLRFPYDAGSTSAISARNSANSNDMTLIDTRTVNSVVDIIGVGLTNTAGVLLKGRSGGAAPTTTDLPAGQWTVWRDTGGATTKLYYNNAGVIQSVALA